MSSFNFTTDELDQMYDEAMAWQPPAQAPASNTGATGNPRSVLNGLLNTQKARTTQTPAAPGGMMQGQE